MPTPKRWVGRIVDAVPISELPACIEDRAVPGHWEGDLLFGDAYSQIATLVERHTRYVMLVKLVDKDSYTVAAALAMHAQTLPQEVYRSLTWDRGSEMAGHKRFTVVIAGLVLVSTNELERGRAQLLRRQSQGTTLTPLELTRSIFEGPLGYSDDSLCTANSRPSIYLLDSASRACNSAITLSRCRRVVSKSCTRWASA